MGDEYILYYIALHGVAPTYPISYHITRLRALNFSFLIALKFVITQSTWLHVIIISKYSITKVNPVRSRANDNTCCFPSGSLVCPLLPAMVQADIIQWANYIRSSMAFDPGRQYFQDQIQQHGFHFLDSYLDNIISKPRHEDVVALLKTPARKKNSGKKPKSTSKLKRVVSSQKLENENEGKENVFSPNNFQKALLKAKAEAELFDDVADAAALEISTLNQTPVVAVELSTDGTSTLPVQQSCPSDSLPPPQVENLTTSNLDTNPGPIELSMIVEDEEPTERSLILNTTFQLSLPSARLKDVQRGERTDGQVQSDISSGEILHSNSSSSVRPASTPESPTDKAALSAMHSDEASFHLAHTYNQDLEPPASNNDQVMDPASPRSRHSSPFEETIPLQDIAIQYDDAIYPPMFPTLPGLLPLRKSMRTSRDPSSGGLGAATPGTGIGKRTSWLMKAREVKALEAKHTSTVGPMSYPTSSTQERSSMKRKSSIGPGDAPIGILQLEDEERQSKVSKQSATDVAPLKAAGQERSQAEAETTLLESQPSSTESQGMLDHFKKTVQGLGFGMTKDKSLGVTAAVSALAEAKALAEARVAERIQKNEGQQLTRAFGPAEEMTSDPTFSGGESLRRSSKHQSRLSVSDLAVDNETMDKKNENAIFHLVPPPPAQQGSDTKMAASAHPFPSPIEILFNKGQPVFVPPSPKPLRKEEPPPLLPTKFTSMSVGLSSNLPSSSVKHPLPITAQSTLESLLSDRSNAVFESQDTPAWLPSTQETEYEVESRSYLDQLDEDDDSWPLHDKVPEGMHWTFGGGDSTNTWSSSEPNHTEKIFPEFTDTQAPPWSNDAHQRSPPAALETSDLEMDELGNGLPATDSNIDSTLSLDDASLNQGQSQMVFSQSAGVFSQATRFVNNFLATSKKGKMEVKSLQLAAAAARKEQEEKDKKAAVLKNMEIRRQQAIQRKAEEERNRQLEEEKKLKDEVERRKREREEHTEKRPLKVPNTGTTKKDEDTFKRKIPDSKRPLSKMAPPPNAKSAFKPTQKTPGTSSSTTTNSLHTSGSLVVGPSNKVSSTVNKAKGKTPAKATATEEEIVHPSQHVQHQMAARVKAQLDAARSEAVTPSESIELPDIDSEYSDSEDEDRAKRFHPPHWAQSPELRQALVDQSSINPDNIFGPIRPLRMEEIFRSRSNRFRARTSSANWAGTDRLTLEEEEEYVRRMGFR
ncbi:hypothetical protein D9757_002950 [Collybiopsis confluens]|uniref:Inner centromere protein ARK-binding domain-containing protein n=1 Tax=Collybiopsis confluens TaxID=2823264 RepID=A0A8H5HW24_9AGAR|nr:hypothetical protein D9757_002950 [Collybiopsis confluens]